MEQITTKIRRWGHSFAVILPKRVVVQEELEEGSDVTLTIQPKNVMTVRALMDWATKHVHPSALQSTEAIMREVDWELYGLKR
jgi:antitoxin component of MazEF toxin-antitoxin module